MTRRNTTFNYDIKSILIASLLILCTSGGWAMERDSSRTRIKVMIGLSYNKSLGGAGSDLEQSMVDSGFDGLSGYTTTGGSVTYPRVIRKRVAALDITVFLKEKMGISLQYGVLESVNVNGLWYDQDPNDPDDVIDPWFDAYGTHYTNKTRHVSVGAVMSSVNRRLQLTAGPSLVIQSFSCRVSHQFYFPDESEQRSVKPGMFVQGHFMIVNKRTWYVGARMAAYFYSSYSFKGETLSMNNLMFNFRPADVSVTTYQIGLTTGIRLNGR